MTSIIKKNGFRNGIILGIILAAMTSNIYFGDIELLGSVWFGTLKIVITVLLGIISIIATKKRLGGFISFKEAFSSYFLTIFVGSLILCIFIMALFTFVFTPEKIELIKNTQLEFNLYIMKLNYATPAQIDEARELSQKMNPGDIVEIIKMSIGFLLRDCLIGLLAALVFRNKRTF